MKQELKDEFGFIGDDYDALAVASVDATIKKYQEEELHPIYLAQKRAIDNGSMTNMIDVKLMDYYVIYLFQGYYDPAILSDDRQKYQSNSNFKDMWDKINNFHVEKPTKNRKNVWLTLDDSKVNKLQQLIIRTFGQEAIDSFKTTFEKEQEQQHLLSMKTTTTATTINNTTNNTTVLTI